MRVFRIRGGELPILFNRSKIALHGQKINNGDKLIVDMGEVVFGPVTVTDHTTQYAVIQLDDDFNYYYDTDADEIEISSLTSILMPYEYYESVTGNIFLDGFLRAAYIDNNGFILVDISDTLPGLVKYFSEAMDCAGIPYQKIENAFVIEDSQIVSRVFDNWMIRLPPKYAVGYLCSFILATKLYTHDNPEYNRYQFVLSGEYEAEVSTDDFFTMASKGQHVLYSLFGSMDPLRYLIDEIDDEEDMDQITNLTIDKKYGIGQAVYQKLSVMIFDYGGYCPEYTDDGSAIIVRKNKYDDEEKIKIGFSDNSIDSDYVLRYEDGNLLLSKMDDGKLTHTHSLFYSNIFNFGTEMSSYFEILFKKL